MFNKIIMEKFQNLNFKKLIIIFSILFVFGIFYGWILFPALFKVLLKSQVPLKPGSKIRLMWEKIPFYLPFRVYIFNVTNPDEVSVGGKPILNEIGPYFFEEWKSKQEIIDDEKEDTATFYATDTFIFRPDLSNGLTGNEKITTLDPLLAGIALSVNRERKPMLPLVSKAIDEIFKTTTPFISTNAMDFLFHGMPIDCSSQEFAPKSVCAVLETEAIGVHRVNETHLKFSLFGSKNATLLTKLKVFRGIKNARDVGRVIEYQDETEQDVWSTDECNELKGSDGTIFPPFLKREDGITAFVPALCTSVKSTYEKQSSYAGVPTERYTLDFGDAKNDPTRHCFCRDPPNDCPPKGTLDLFSCWSAPFVVSLPHFYNADPELLKQVVGLSPNKEKHGVAIDFVRTTGTPVAAANRLQFSVALENVEEVIPLRNVPKLIFPLLWIEEAIQLNKTFTNMLKYQLFIPKKISNIFKWSCVISGFFGTIVSGYFFYKQSTENIVSTVEPAKSIKSNKNSPVLNGVQNGVSVHAGENNEKNSVVLSHGNHKTI